jgi:hypothetical protein
VKTRISKWYLDCITENGNLFIGYTASISLGFVPLHLASRLTFIDRIIDQQTENPWFRPTTPEETGTGLAWLCPQLRLKGSWEPLIAPASRRLFENERGSILWNCVQPLSAVKVSWNGKEAISGLGYAEKLELSVTPGDIGLTRLHWGRFTAPDTSVIWIQWSGQEYRSIVLLNGEDMDHSRLSENCLNMRNGSCLQWTDSALIRSGFLETSVMESLPWLRRIFPSWMSNIHESKWLSRGRLFDGGHMRAEGWIIHEIVVFRNACTQKTDTARVYEEPRAIICS